MPEKPAILTTNNNLVKTLIFITILYSSNSHFVELMYKSHFHAITEIFVCPNVPMLLSNVRPWVPLKGMDKLDMSWTCPRQVLRVSKNINFGDK